MWERWLIRLVLYGYSSMQLRNIDKDYLLWVINSSYSYSDVLKKLNKSPTKQNTLKKIIFERDIDIHHFNPYHRTRYNSVLPDHSVYTNNSTYSSISRRLKKDWWLLYACDMCENKWEWNWDTLTLQVDHIDWDHTNNCKKNLRWLCPNCHSQTITYSNKKR